MYPNHRCDKCNVECPSKHPDDKDWVYITIKPLNRHVGDAWRVYPFIYMCPSCLKELVGEK